MKYIVIAFCFAFLANNATAQQTITGDFRDISFEEFVSRIERQTDYQFYFKRNWTDSLKVSTSATQESLTTLLSRVFEGTDLKFAIAPDMKVFLSNERNITPLLANGFFEQTPSKKSSDALAFDYSDYEKRERKMKAAEEKLYTIGTSTGDMQGRATISGHVTDAESGEPVIGASIFVEGLSTGVATDPSGFYSLTIPKGRYSWRIESLGMKKTKRQIMVYGNGKLNIELQQEVTPLKEVVVESDRDARVASVQMGIEKLDIKTMKQMPTVLGETDVLKVILTLPGVQSVGEGASGVNIRGGATNQNLILFNDATVYNPSHLFGFFSAFNPDVLKSVELYKSGINAEYGGRLSSVLDIVAREGNLKKFSASGGISPITGRLMIEGPVLKDKMSFMLAGRSTYSNWLLRQLKAKELRRSEAGFYDLNANVNYKINEKNTLQMSAYMSSDKFTLNNDTLYQYSDRNASLKWKRVLSNKLYGVLTATYSQYNYDVSSDDNPTNAFEMDFQIKQWMGKADFSYFRDSRQTLTAGLQVIRYELSPGNLSPIGAESLIIADKLAAEHGMESAAYVGENFDVTPTLSIYAGVRYSLYQYLGPRNVFQYASAVSRTESTITDTLSYSGNEKIATYHGAEPRLSVRLLIGKSSSIKASYNRMRQYIQMLSNTTAVAPTDIWKLSDTYIKPQIADQYSIGYYRNMRGGSLEFSTEAYYKEMQNAIDFKDGAELLLNHHIETDIVPAVGKAYGAEFMLKKPAGKLNGWISYTYSRSLLQTRSEFKTETVNSGVYYPSNYDKPHAVNVITNYKFNRRFNFSFNMTYSTGRPITIPLAKYELNGTRRLYYSDRNEYRIPDYFRTDVSVNIEGNHRVRKLAHSSWTFAIYNLTGRANAYSVYFVSENGRIKGYKLSVFARPIPTITYNFRF